MFCYVPNVMSRIKNCLKEHKITPVYSNIYKMKNRFASTKEKICDDLKSGVYAVVCGVCKRRKRREALQCDAKSIVRMRKGRN